MDHAVGGGHDRRTAMKSLLAAPYIPARPLAEAVGERDFKIRAAQSWGDRSQASFLVSRLYSRRGYRSSARPDDDLNRGRLTLVATDREAVVGTLTVGYDSEPGLLADDLFPDEVNALRQGGREVCEFTKLAMDGLVHSQRALAAMFHVAFIHAHRLRGCDNLLIEVNPRHTRYYEAKLGFKVAGPERLNRRVNAPAVLLVLDLWYAQSQIDRFGGKPQMCSGERSLYPFGFSPQEEAGILGRLRAEHADSGRSGLA
jgi:hypothetical protein